MTFKSYHVLRGTLAAIGSVALVVGSGAPALAARPTPNSFGEIEALCPSVGTTGLTFGLTREQQNQTALAKVTAEDPTRLFREAMADYSSWSDRLYRLSWYSAMEESDQVDGVEWQLGLAQMLEKGGWRDLADDVRYDPRWQEWRYAKEFMIDGEPRQLLIEIEMSGNYAVTCSDIELNTMADNEGLGLLEPDSPRPAMVEVARAVLPDPSTCDRPEIHDMFSTNEKLEAAGHKLDEIFPKANAEGDAARFGERLRTWLVWKMLESGKIPQEDIWQVEEGLYPDASEERQDDLIGFLEDAGAIMEAQKQGDGQTVCQKFLSLFAKQRAADERQAARWAKLNAALEAEAVRRGIALD
ncbi:hypothetical protein G6N82_03040 [Altererythrobacter sp. BO-6]|uniref:hypothetical protein n=1 Tax=Altererythrobacter sp. BO-6 TaxID=2604537 RepID=UPI0013E19A9D|nr:hypothetical protein [Altererythrobacter sp. BO-6]QIG53261.1 hypothetical protein G6N82_03040 [Altererythrobacter sp. BO-6]